MSESRKNSPTFTSEAWDDAVACRLIHAWAQGKAEDETRHEEAKRRAKARTTMRADVRAKAEDGATVKRPRTKNDPSTTARARLSPRMPLGRYPATVASTPDSLMRGCSDVVAAADP